MNFSEFEFDKRIDAGIKAANYTTPTPIQAQAIPVVLEGRDVMGLAQTGTGKTAAFLLPILQRLTKGPMHRVRALIVAPTRELAEQIRQASVDLAKQTKIRTISIYGGVGKGKQLAQIKRGAEIVVACPGRLLDLMSDKAIDLSKVEVLVLDEADRMCDMGFLPDIKRIIRALPKQRQTLFFSATMPTDIRQLSDEFLDNPETVQIGMIAPAKTVSHSLFPITQKLKKNFLMDLLPTLSAGRMLIFTRTKYRARNLARDLDRKGYRSTALQGNMSQNQRTRSIEGFRKGKFDILVATDIAARGIDVTEITHVINFDMPDTVDAYTHRIGRTGRAKQDGEAFTFATEDDTIMIRDIEKLLGQPVERRQLDGFNYGEFDPTTALPVWKPGQRNNGRPKSQNSNKQKSGRGRNQRRRGRGGNRNRQSPKK